MITAGALPVEPMAHTAATLATPMLTGIRTAVHPTFDRIVLDLTPGYRPQVTSRFTDELQRDGSGAIEWLTGCVFSEVVVHGARAHDDAGNSSYLGPRKFRTRNLSNVMAIAITGGFEATLSIGVGMRKRTWVKVFTLTGPNRVVIDVGR
jgi:hypothetical protein